MKNGNLVLSRRAGEQVVIGDGITVTVASVRGDRVRLVVNAPQSVPVLRKEVADRQQQSGTLVTVGEVS